jgi:hypothetical protein
MDTPERGDYFFSEATKANQALVKAISETGRVVRL